MKSESAMRERYAAHARAREAELCCRASYDPQFLKVIPDKLVERDYACGDPSRWLREVDTVLDLDSGTGIFNRRLGRRATRTGFAATDHLK
jgi:arsenite methyltransferase